MSEFNSDIQESAEKLYQLILMKRKTLHPDADCVFTDKADEGCYLCEEARDKISLLEQEAIAQYEILTGRITTVF